MTTGIFKEPVKGRVRLRVTNLEGDGQADSENHGGIYKAVYAYPIEHYEFWKRELARDDFPFGQFGENFTVRGMLEHTTHIGDVFRVGGALVQVTQPRAPCFKLGLRRPDGLGGEPPALLRPGEPGEGQGDPPGPGASTAVAERL